MNVISDDPTVIRPALDALRTSFHNGRTKSLDYREAQLKNLVRGMQELTPKFEDALKKDIGLSSFMTYMLSLSLCINDVNHTISNFRKWARALPADTSMTIGPAKSYVLPEPYGVALVISAWNYPLYTLIPPAATAIAAGNCVILKPSEMAPATSKVVVELFEKYLDKNCYRVLEGKVEVSKAIIQEKFDVIVFTGSPEKGKLIAKAAAENLIPCVLELGGKSPTIVDRDANLDNAAMRIVQGRFMNAGQTCVAPDYCFAHKDIKAQFLQKIREYIIKFHGEDPSKDEHYARIINQDHTRRLKSYLDENHGGRVVFGGQVDESQKYVAPTVIDCPNLDSKLMTEEIFGPILPVLEFSNIQDVIQFINQRDKPLALYYYGGLLSSNKKRIINETSSGAVMINDSIFHLLNSDLPFGGVGNSGYGTCHGLWGFNNVSHLKPVMEKIGGLNVFPFNARYPPYTSGKQNLVRTLFKLNAVNQGHIVKGAIFTVAAIAVCMNVKQEKLNSARFLLADFLKNLSEKLRQGPKPKL